MIMEGCQGKPQISIMDKICPQCGHEIEIFSIDTEAVCENCSCPDHHCRKHCGDPHFHHPSISSFS